MQIRNRFTNAVLFESAAETVRQAVLDAVAARANLADANLARANLTGANLARANLADANLARAYLARADLTGANLADANLADANLARAKHSAPLDVVRADIEAVLACAPAEVPALLAAVREGRIDGSVYSGACACLVGTIANARGCDYQNVPGLTPDSNRPAERWFTALMPGHVPELSMHAALTAMWIEHWLARQGAKA